MLRKLYLFLRIHTGTKMPKKKRSNNKRPFIMQNNALAEGTSRHDVIKHLMEIFKNVDKCVIQLIADECEYNVEQAVETLINITSAEKEQVFQAVDKDELTLSNFSNLLKNQDSDKSGKLNFLQSCNNADNDVYNNNTSLRESDGKSCKIFTTSCNVFNNAGASASDSILHPEKDIKNATLQFIVPSLPMQGSPSPHKSHGLNASTDFWNVSDSRHFSSSASKDLINRTGYTIEETEKKIKSGSRVLIILRGLPGSGKSSLGLKLKFSGSVFSTDDFFMKKGKYFFIPALLSEAHEWNQNRTKKALENGVTPVIIDNTNVEAWEMKPYVLMGKKYNYEIIILEPNTPWKLNVKELALKNKHGVPKYKIAKMKEKYDTNITVEKILSIKNLFCSINNRDLTKDTVSEMKDNQLKNKNQISLKAVVHMEDNSHKIAHMEDNSHKVVHTENNSHKVKCNDLLLNPIPEFLHNSETSQLKTVCNLDQLRELVRNGSEDSQSYSSTSSSSQIGWESITDRDYDFWWSTSSGEQKLNTEQSYRSSSTDNLNVKESTDPSSNQDDTCSSSNSYIENLPSSDDDSSAFQDKLGHFHEPEKINFDHHQKMSSSDFENVTLENDNLRTELCIEYVENDRLTSSSENCDYHEKLWPLNEYVHTNCIDNSFNSNLLNVKVGDSLSMTEKHLMISEETIENTNKKNEELSFIPKPQRNNILTFSKNHLTCDNNIKNFVDSRDTLDWDTLNDKTNESVGERKREVSLLSPKPQRQIFEDEFCANNNINLPNYKSVLNISLDKDNQEWKFPEYIVDDTEQENTNISKRSLSLKKIAQSQTELQDFNFLHQISEGRNNLDSCNYRIINAKSNNIIYSKDDNLNSSAYNFEISNNSNVLSFDNSTSTDDLIDDIEISQKLVYLQECFPDISEEDLLYNLEVCHYNVEWLSDLLLEWGYQYNVPKCNTNISSDSGSTSSLSKGTADLPKEVKLAVGNDPQKKWRVMLNVDFANELVELFGPVSKSSSVDAYVDIDLKLGQQIHEAWKNTACNSNQTLEKVDVYVDMDLKLGQKIHESWENIAGNSYQTLGKDIKSRTSQNSRSMRSNCVKPLKCNKEPSSLNEIMDMEFALQLHKEEKLKKDEDFVTKLKRLELYNMFPGAESIILDDIFDNNNQSLYNALHVLGEDMEQQEKVEKKKTVKKIEEDINEWKKLNLLKEFETGNWSEWVYKDSVEPVQDSPMRVITPTMSSEAAEFRERAAEEYRLRMEYITKAQNAYCRGMKDVASFYAQQGRDHGTKFKQANKIASELITLERNSAAAACSLDLHGLHVKEAINLLDRFLREKKQYMIERQQTTPLIVSVITGQGLHSIQGPKLRPSVEKYLKQTGYKYSEMQSGKLDVTVLPE